MYIDTPADVSLGHCTYAPASAYAKPILCVVSQLTLKLILLLYEIRDTTYYNTLY